MPKADGYKNLVKRSREELIEMGKKGGRANAERIKRQKSLNEIAKSLLMATVSEKKARDILGDYTELLDGDFTMGAILTLKQMMEAKEGNTKAYEVMRDTAGFKPVEQVHTDLNIMTDEDKKLLEKVAKRTGVQPEKEQ